MKGFEQVSMDAMQGLKQGEAIMIKNAYEKMKEKDPKFREYLKRMTVQSFGRISAANLIRRQRIVEISCSRCGINFYRPPRLRNQKFCSHLCRREVRI